MVGKLWNLNSNLHLPHPKIHFLSNMVRCFQSFWAQHSLSWGSFYISSTVAHHSSLFTLC